MSASPYAEIVPTVPNYRDPEVPVEHAFTWEALPQDEEGGLVRVVFTSQVDETTRRADPDKVAHLHHLDEVALEDAEKQPGFLWYYADTVDEVTLMARSFCLWRSAEAAAAASQRAAHQLAVAFTMGPGWDVYRHYSIQKDQVRQTPQGLAVARLARMVVKYGQVMESWRAG